MADLVQKALEELLPAFENLERLRLFTSTEIKAVVGKCKNYEYKLHNQAYLRPTFVAYIQYLIDFSNLIYIRRKSKKCKRDKDDIERCVSFKIETLFRLACERFKGDKNVWLSRIHFLKTKEQHTKVSKLYMTFLNMHPEDENLWISAAKYEFQQMVNRENARKILQRALRFNCQSEKLWLELFRMELLIRDQLVKRKTVLQSVAKTEEPLTDNHMEDVILDGRLALLVFRQAISEINNGNFGLKFLHLLKLIPETNDIFDTIYQQLKASFGKTEEIVNFDIEHELNRDVQLIAANDHLLPEEKRDMRVEAEKRALLKLKDVCLQFNTEKMWQKYVDFAALKNYASLMHVFRESSDHCAMNVNFYLEWLKHASNEQECSEILAQAVQKHPRSAQIRMEHLKHMISVRADDKKSIMETFNESIDALQEKETLGLWKLAVDWAAEHCPSKMDKIFQQSFLQQSPIAQEMKIQYLDYALASRNISGLRETFLRLAMMKPNSSKFYEHYRKLELEEANPDSNLLRKSFELELDECGCGDADAWLRYFRFETRNAPQCAALVYNRAIKALDHSVGCKDEFVKLCSKKLKLS